MNIYKLIEKSKLENFGSMRTYYKDFFSYEHMNINKMPVFFTTVVDYVLSNKI